MGQVADDMINGLICEWCGVWMPDYEEPGYPRLCEGCLNLPEAKDHSYYQLIKKEVDMEVSRVTVGGTFNIGNYESVRLEVSVDREEPSESTSEMFERASAMMRSMAQLEIKSRRE